MSHGDIDRSTVRRKSRVRNSSTSHGTKAVLAGSVAAAGAAYLFLTLGARILGPERFAPISALWTLQFLALSVALIPLEQLAIRAGTTGGEPPYVQAAVVGMLTALAVGGYSFVDRNALFADESVFIILAVISVATLTVFATGRGLVAGAASFRAYGAITGAQSAIRFVAGVSLLMLTSSAAAAGWVMALAPLVVLAWRPFRSQSFGRRSSASSTPFLVGLFVANASAQLLLLGGPIVLVWNRASPTEVSVFFIVLSLFRAPVAVASNAVARVLPPLTRLAEELRYDTLRKSALQLTLGGLTLAAAAAAFGWWAGPAVTQLLFGGDFRPARVVAALVAAGSVLATAAIVGNQILAGLNRTPPLAGSWLVAVAAAAAVLAADIGAAPARVALAFATGEAAAVVGIASTVWLVTRPVVSVNRGTNGA